ncbi:MAG: isoprenyl transferase [Clostridia bacterium]|nr:isoprenyl transferase [Clostridia bacterium]
MWFKKKKPLVAVEDLPREALPTHVAIIMDGNGRWAKKRGLPRYAGHVTGAKVFRTMVKHCEKRGIHTLTVYAFSTENWKRPKEEVDAIMNLLREYLKESLADFQKENIRTRFLGDRAPLAADIRQLMEEAEASTAHKTGMNLNIALNYGGRNELTAAVREIAAKVAAGTLSPEAIGEDTISDHLYTAGQPDPDVIIRPSGEHRLSNYLIWQAAYAEYVFMDDILWPDFTTDDLDAALLEYARRNRRFGGV